MASDPYKLRIDFMPVLRRTIQTYGVVSDFIYYHDPVLDKWIGAPEPGNKRKAREFIFRYDPRDISHLIFWDPSFGSTLGFLIAIPLTRGSACGS